MTLVELQLDRIVGPTHHFGGLGVGNVASKRSAGNRSNPAAAAIQGLEKMQLVASWTGRQLVVPPQPRPDLQTLRNLGFSGRDDEVLLRARETAPELLSAVCSCSAMWTANAATVTPAVDGLDAQGRTRLTVANLVSSIHRTTEPDQTAVDLAAALPPTCQIEPALVGGYAMRDEGAANHMRLSVPSADAGIHVFVYGDGDPKPTRHEARQARSAFEAIVRRHGIPRENAFFLKQHPDAIDAGAFHNDVVAMSHEDRLIYHRDAFFEPETTLNSIDERFQALFDRKLVRIEVDRQRLSLDQAVRTYLFNSQIVSVHPDAPPRIICTRQVESDTDTQRLVQQWCHDGIFESVHYVDLDQSMSAGGGPACLRLRIPIAEEWIPTVPVHSQLTEQKREQLLAMIRMSYPTDVTLDDLGRLDFHQEAQKIQTEISRLLTATT